jgi:SsrA-binding protein
MAKKKPIGKKTIQNKRARFDYTLGDSLVVGMQLSGAEVKSLRMGHGNLTGAYVTVKDNEIYLLNGTIHGTNGVNINDANQTRTRKLLAKRREIDSLIAAKQQGRSIVPLEILTSGRFIKLRIAIGTGKKNYDKRATLKARDENRQINRALKPRI